MKVTTVATHTPEYTRRSEGDVVELASGTLLLAYMEFSGDGSDLATTRIVAQQSADGGASWRDHRVVVETAPGDLNVYSPNLVRAADGGILLMFMRQHGHTPPASTLEVWKSADEGATFRPFAVIASRRDYSLCNATVKRLGSGRLLLPVSPTDNPQAHPYQRRGVGAVLLSDDDGSSWREAETRLSLPMRGVMEPHVEQTRDGRVLMVMRSQLGSLFLSESLDEGLTWSLPQTTGLRTPESCPELTRIPSTGDLLVVWNNSPYDPGYASHYGKRTPLSAAVSGDEGRSWGTARDIETDPRRAFSNPGCRFTRGGVAVVNYWTCEYLPDGRMQDVIDLRAALIETDWFYGP